MICQFQSADSHCFLFAFLVIDDPYTSDISTYQKALQTVVKLHTFGSVFMCRKSFVECENKAYHPHIWFANLNQFLLPPCFPIINTHMPFEILPKFSSTKNTIRESTRKIPSKKKTRKLNVIHSIQYSVCVYS